MKRWRLLSSAFLLAGTAGSQRGGAGVRVAVSIRPMQDTVRTMDELTLQVTLANTGVAAQKLLFDQPALPTGGPWRTRALVLDGRMQSPLQLEDKSTLSSQVFTQEELQPFYYSLEPGKSISKTYRLTDIAVFKKGPLLPGPYYIQLFYAGNFSNKVVVVLR